jgi:ribose 5-phosphate isomerase B
MDTSNKKVAVGNDHAGYEYKLFISKRLKKMGYEVVDKGTNGTSSVDYPDYAHPVAEAVAKSEVGFGVLICGSGNGVCITANKHEGIRAVLAWEEAVAEVTRLHNDANVLCLPARFISKVKAGNILDKFVATTFEGGRHQNRINKIACS